MVLALLVLAGVLALPAASGAAHAAAPSETGPAISGQSCAPGTGVTVVVDFTAAEDRIEIGCALGVQANGFDALHNAGFTTSSESGAGTVCTIDGQPTQGFPYCWTTGGFWSYWTTTPEDAWTFRVVGAGGTGELPVDTVEGWSWAEGFASSAPRLAVADLGQHAPAGPADCAVAPVAPVISIIDEREVLPFTLPDDGEVEVAVLGPDEPLSAAVYDQVNPLPLEGHSGLTRVLARRAGGECTNPPLFDATYDVRPTYAPRWSIITPGNPSPAVDKADPAIKGFATGYEDYVPGANVNESFQTPANALGPISSGLVVLGDRGRITLTFDHPIADGPGDDVAVFENGFAVNGATDIDFLELGYVEVSSDGTTFVRFDSASRRATPVGGFQGQPATDLGGLAGKDLAGKGTPFDLTALRNAPEVRDGSVDLSAVTHLRIVDVTGDGLDLDSFGRPIYDAHPTTGSAGFDLTGVAVLNEVAPVIEVTTAPPGFTASTDATVAFTVDDDTATVTCALDDADAGPCSSPVELTGLADGPHVLEIWATRPNGSVGTTSVTWTVHTPGPDPEWLTPSAADALTWLEGQLAANSWTLPGFSPGSTDWGLTMDAILALAGGGRGENLAARQATDQVEAHVTDYVTWAPEHPEVRVAGALAKELLVAAIQGADTTSFGGWDLDAELRALLVDGGTWSGRFADHNPPFPDSDQSNGFSQALALLGLARTTEGVPAAATGFLLAQQCPGGGFRLSYVTTRGCTSGAAADTDATAMAVQALLVVERTPAVDAALGLATRWLLDQQDPVTGSFNGTGFTAEPNTNSTGLIAQVLRQVGLTTPATAAAGWIGSLQLTPANATGTPAAPELGAIAYNPGALAVALDTGIADNGVDQWRRATSQAVLGLGLPAFGSIGDDAPVPPVAPVDLDRFSDVAPSDLFFDDIMWLTAAGITTGNLDGTFGPTSPMTRQAQAAFLYRMAGSPAFTAPEVPSFSDVAPSHVFYRQIEWMKAEGLTTGNVDGTFGPETTVTRQVFAAFLYRWAGSPPVPPDAPTFTDVEPGHTFFDAISWLASTGVTTGYTDGTFQPVGAVSRQTTAAFLHRFSLLP